MVQLQIFYQKDYKIKEIRKKSDTPIIVLSARSSENDKIEALDLGANDYVTKPFGTGHAVLCCKGTVTEPFVVINADDYYGADAFRTMYRTLCEMDAQGKAAMVGYRLKNTLSIHMQILSLKKFLKDFLLQKMFRLKIVIFKQFFYPFTEL